MVANEGGYYAQIGIISWGFGCADPDFPGVYARVTENLDFIKNFYASRKLAHKIYFT